MEQTKHHRKKERQYAETERKKARNTRPLKKKSKK
jgi:hypothetical protein